MKDFYEQTVKLPHNKKLVSVDIETGDMKELPKRMNNIPQGKSKLDYERYHISNDKFIKAIISTGVLDYEHLGIISYMSSIAEINTNSLRPLTNDTTAVDLAEKFGINRKKVKVIFDKLFKVGVFLQLNYYSYSEDREVTYWVLNPYISWKGKLKDDSIFSHFKDTTIAKLLQ